MAMKTAHFKSDFPDRSGACASMPATVTLSHGGGC